MQHLSVTSKAQVPISKEMRLGLRGGSQIRFELKGDYFEMRVERRPAEAVESAFGKIKCAKPTLPADFDAASLR